MKVIVPEIEQDSGLTVDELREGRCYQPHQRLGLHHTSDGHQVIRVWRPGATTLHLEVLGKTVEAMRIHADGLFALRISAGATAGDYKVYHTSGLLAHDPYAFLPTFGDIDQHLFGKGTHYDLHRTMGANLSVQQGIEGVKFTVWAPSAKAVSLLADFNHWDNRVNPMRTLGGSGVWELFVPGIGIGEKYKFQIRSENGVKVKADPYAKQCEVRPSSASVVTDVNTFEWEDSDWIKKRNEQREHRYPMNCYEVHLGSWRKKDGQFLGYHELAHQLGDYCKEMGFTHVELMPVSEHPFDESWGYQVTGFYAVTSRFGTPQDFQYFVNHLHKEGIGIILDWVPAHFPSDDFALAEFDGSALYEHVDPRQGFHPHWNTHIFNYGRPEVSNFLIGSALYWLEMMHIDGLRVDAVASMLYLDYGRKEGEWIPNCYGGKENLDAIEFIKHLNSVVHESLPGVAMIAEESTSFPGVTSPVGYGGLGFDMKWNMGWMNDTLHYFAKDPVHRRHHHHDLTFGLLYAFSERFCLVLSHDEVVHGKGSLIAKMPGDMWQQFANLRLLYSYMCCQPGKNLLFMGGEIGQWNEWNCKEEIEWILLDFPTHRGIQQLVKAMNHFVLEHPCLWEGDFDYHGFEWVNLNDQDNSVLAYRRKGSDGELLCVHNFTPTYHSEYNLYPGNLKSVTEVFNSDDQQYGGSGKLNGDVQVLRGPWGDAAGMRIQLAPLATMIFKLEYA